jgi:hypothetical protein
MTGKPGGRFPSRDRQTAGDGDIIGIVAGITTAFGIA